MATSNSALQKTSPSIAGRKQHCRPALAEARLEGIDQGGELVPAHDAGEEHAAQHQAEAEARPPCEPEAILE